MEGRQGMPLLGTLWRMLTVEAALQDLDELQDYWEGDWGCLFRIMTSRRSTDTKLIYI